MLGVSSKLCVALRQSEPHRVRLAALGNRLSSGILCTTDNEPSFRFSGCFCAQFYAIRCVLLLARVIDDSVDFGWLMSCPGAFGDSNLVDPASSHMLVSKIKPCMSKYKFFTAKL